MTSKPTFSSINLYWWMNIFSMFVIFMQLKKINPFASTLHMSLAKKLFAIFFHDLLHHAIFGTSQHWTSYLNRVLLGNLAKISSRERKEQSKKKANMGYKFSDAATVKWKYIIIHLPSIFHARISRPAYFLFLCIVCSPTMEKILLVRKDAKRLDYFITTTAR